MHSDHQILRFVFVGRGSRGRSMLVRCLEAISIRMLNRRGSLAVTVYIIM